LENQYIYNSGYLLEYIYPPSPTTVRGYGMNLTYSADKQKLGYCSSNLIILRNTLVYKNMINDLKELYRM